MPSEIERKSRFRSKGKANNDIESAFAPDWVRTLGQYEATPRRAVEQSNLPETSAS